MILRNRFRSFLGTLSRHAGSTVFLIIFMAQSPAAVCIGVSLEQVLDQWAEALGGRQRLEEIQTIHGRWGIEMIGLEGVVEEWLTTTGYHRFDLNLAGIFHITMVRTPEHCWYMDQNGKVSERGGKELEDEISDIYLGTWSHLLDTNLAGTAEFLGLDSEIGHLRVRILPDGGTENTFWIDPETHLPVRSESPEGSGETSITTFAEWRSVENVLCPAIIVETTGTEEDSTVMQLRELFFNETPPSGTFEKPEEEIDDVRFDSSQAALNIPLDIDGVHLFLKTHINDSGPLWFILDSGAQMTCIDKDLAHDLGFEFIGELVGDGVGEETVEVSLVQNVSFRVPGAELTGQTVAAVALRDILEARLGRELDGILGYDFISRFVVEIDYWDGKLHLYDRHDWEYRGSATPVPIRFVENDPVCDAVITMPDGRSLPCNLYLDTGSGVDIRLNEPFTEKHDLLSALPEKVEFTGGYGIGGQTREYLGRIASVTIGDLEFRTPICSFSQDSKGVGADISMAGKLGGGIFERCTLILDYERNRIFFEPNPRFELPFLGDMSGLTFDTGGRGDWHTFTVRHVMKDSPSDKAGVQVGDIIVSVDGISAEDLQKNELTAMFRDQGRTVTLGLRRDGDIHYREVCIEPML